LIERPKKRIRTDEILAIHSAGGASLKSLLKINRHRWIIERDCEELKQELGLGHYEGRGWRGFHHHATLCIAAHGFLVVQWSRSPSARFGHIGL
jgi:SRSO17 transposase